MKKSEQLTINNVCEKEQEKALKEFNSRDNTNHYKFRNWQRLRYMSAEVVETDNYYILKSYNTLIGFINKNTDECFDVLRLVYGYTPSSAKHISAFDHDYGKQKYGCKNRYTWRDC